MILILSYSSELISGSLSFLVLIFVGPLGTSFAAASGYRAGILEFDDVSGPVPKSISPASLDAAESDILNEIEGRHLP